TKTASAWDSAAKRRAGRPESAFWRWFATENHKSGHGRSATLAASAPPPAAATRKPSETSETACPA
ncbi:hypothetical protein QT586_22550, partial [Xanthomonas citri pv. citri]